MIRSRSAVPVLALLASLPLAAACGGGDDSTSSTAAGGAAGSGTAGSATAGSGTAGKGTAGTGTAGTGTAGTGTAGTTTAGSAGTGTAGSAGKGVPATFDCQAPTGALPALTLTDVASNLSNPLLVTRAPGDTTRLYVVQQGGKIRIVKNGMLQAGDFVDLSSLLTAGGERGLLGVAFHPKFATNRKLYAHFSAKASAVPGTANGDTVIAELTATDGDKADVATHKVLLTVKQPFSNHNGGSINFSPTDGFLYIGLGDGGDGGDPMGNGQKLSTLLGKMLRIDVDAKSPYAIPAGNLPAAMGKEEIWDYGLRNPYRTEFDPCTGDLYIADVGQNQIEEIDVEPAGKGLKNYGWNAWEGNQCYTAGCKPDGITMPVATYPHSMGCSVSGGAVYRASKVPALRGRYFYGDYCTGRIWSFAYDAATDKATDLKDHTQELGTMGSPVSAIGYDEEGALYVVFYSGTVSRLDAK